MVISIVTPSYNQGEYIEKTIRSVISQIGNFYIDYIIADGGSTDRTVDIIRRYDKLLKEKKPIIRCKGVTLTWWTKKDNGQSSAINAGIKIARGDIVAYINSDDYYFPGVFSRVSEIFKKNPDLDLLYGDCLIVDSFGKEHQLLKSAKTNFNRLKKEGNFICQPSAFFSKKIIDKVGLFDEKLKYVFDYEMWLRIYKNKGNGMYISSSLAAFRRHQSSKTVKDKELFWPEKKQVALMYGARYIDPIFLSRFEQKIKKTINIQKISPKFYSFLRKIFHGIYDRYYYET